MKISSAEFVKSSRFLDECPKPVMQEFSFIGRSNVGKSSLINSITKQKNLALTSGKPGKTKLINHFLINSKWYLVDLPGYGFAKASKKERNEFSKIIENYLLNRKNLICTFLLIDSRLKPQKNDLDFITFLGERQIPFAIIFTKTDKLKPVQLDNNISHYKEVLESEWEALPEIFLTSSTKNIGLDSIVKYINNFV